MVIVINECDFSSVLILKTLYCSALYVIYICDTVAGVQFFRCLLCSPQLRLKLNLDFVKLGFITVAIAAAFSRSKFPTFLEPS